MVCRICGREFTADNPRQIICSKECKKIAQRAWSRKYRDKNLGRIKERAQARRELHKIEAKRKPDTIVAIGYAERQIANSLNRAGKENTEL